MCWEYFDVCCFDTFSIMSVQLPYQNDDRMNLNNYSKDVNIIPYIIRYEIKLRTHLCVIRETSNPPPTHTQIPHIINTYTCTPPPPPHLPRKTRRHVA